MTRYAAPWIFDTVDCVLTATARQLSRAQPCSQRLTADMDHVLCPSCRTCRPRDEGPTIVNQSETFFGYQCVIRKRSEHRHWKNMICWTGMSCRCFV
jgi:hypothetical protein